MNYLTFDHEHKKSWFDICPKLIEKHKLSQEIKEPVILHTTDDKLNYIIGSFGEEVDMKRKMYDDTCRPDYNRFDFNLCNEDNKAIADVGNKHDHIPPMSFFAIKDVEMGKEWYREKYPQMPDLVIDTASRYQWGELPKNRQQVRSEKRKNIKKKEKEQKALEIKRKRIELDFN